MKFFPTRQTDAAGPDRRGFTLAEVLAALLLMGIIVPVALQGMSVVSRAAVLAQRKAAAMRVAERVLNEHVVLVSQGQATQGAANGVDTDGDASYPWTLQSEAWAEDAMTQMTVHVTFTVRGANYEMSASTLFDPGASTPGTASRSSAGTP